MDFRLYILNGYGKIEEKILFCRRLDLSLGTPHPVFSIPAKIPDVSPTNRDMYDCFGKCTNFAHFPE